MEKAPMTSKEDEKFKRPIPIVNIGEESEERVSSQLGEFDRVLGGGIVKGSTILLGGEPGVGKSTLALQVAGNLAKSGFKTLYFSGEESESQIALRGKRIDCLSENLFIVSDPSLELLKKLLCEDFHLVVVDSIQTLRSREVDGFPGSISQVKAAMDVIIDAGKRRNISAIIIGHITKEGFIAGPKTLEHMVDVVLYMEGEKDKTLRLLRPVKNRFGPTGDVGVFEMTQKGLRDVENPSSIFLSDTESVEPGSAVASILVEERPMLVEVQALVSESHFGMPKRTFIGVDPNRASLIISILEKKLHLPLGSQDIFVNVTGGIKVKDPGADLAVAVSIMSSFFDRSVPKKTCFLGEIGLTGEIRRVNLVAERVREAIKLGFSEIFIPEGSNVKEKPTRPVPHLKDVKKVLFK